MKEMKKDQEESRFLKLRHRERARLQESNSAEEDEEPSFLKLIDTERARLQESNFEEARREWIAEHSLKHEKMLADLGDEMPRRETTSPLRKEATTYLRLEKRWLLDALCRHREILRREINFLRGEVNSRGFATFSGKKAYSESQSNGLMIPPLLFSDLSGSTGFKVVGVKFPHLVTSREESLDLLLRESDHLRYRIQSLASIMRVFGTPVTSDKSKMNLFLMSRAAAMISKTMQTYSKEDTTSPHLLHRAHWESIWGSQMASHGVFDDITTLSPMQFTPGNTPYSATICPALQIYSIQIVELNVNLNWPLRVYGVVAARDTVDRNRNLLFYRSRANYQLVEKDDPFLRLTGPSRAIVAVEPVTFEVELKIKYPGAEHLDTALFSCIYNWRAVIDTTPMFSGFACSAQLSLEQLPRAIQATIVSVRLVEGLWNPNHGCRVSCSLSAEEDPTPREVVLLDCSRRDAAKRCPIGSDGYFGLARNVVSAELQSTMKVVVQTQWLRNGGPQGYVEFPVRQYCQTSKGSCFVGKCEVEVVVAWSLLVKNKLDLML